MLSRLLNLRNRQFFVLDLLLLACVPTIALLFRVEWSEVFSTYSFHLALFTVLALFVKPIVFVQAGLYARYWRYASVDELGQIAIAVSIASLLINLFFYLVVIPIAKFSPSFPRSISLSDWLLTFVVVGGSRFAVRLAEQHRYRSLGITSENRVLVIGAGDAGRSIVREIQVNPGLGLSPVGFIDDDVNKQGVRIHDVKVLGKSGQLTELAQQYKVSQAIIAMPTAPGKKIREIVRACEQAKLAVRIVPGMSEILGGRVTVNQIRPVQIEDLLRREPIKIDEAAVRTLVGRRRVLVTGAGGSIGSELCRKLAGFDPAEIVLLGHGEDSIFHLAAEFSRLYPKVPVASVIADVREREHLAHIFARFNPDIVFHAAAHKHVSLMEENLEEAVTNNILGTRNVIELAAANHVQRLVLISTDKAVNPASVMGATKRVAELINSTLALQSHHNYVSVRFGNVLGSRGSVVNIFREQIARGGPVTVTDAEMRRYFMTIPEAVQLVLQAATLGAGGEIFVLDMGEPIKIIDMARDLIELSGLRVGSDVDIQFTGLKPGEKLFEELFLADDHYERTQHEKIFVSRNGLLPSVGLKGSQPADTLNRQVDLLIEAARAGQRQHIRHYLKQIVPEYQIEDVPLVNVPALERSQVVT